MQFRAAKTLRLRLPPEPLEERALMATDLLSSLSGVVFNDLTLNGHTSDDLAIPGVTVRLYRDNGNGVFVPGSVEDTLVGTTTTDTSGGYRFDDLPAGTYFVQQTPPAGISPVAATDFFKVELTGAETLGKSIDTFAEQQVVSVFGVEGGTDANTIAAAGAIGGARDLSVLVTSNSAILVLTSDQQHLAFGSGPDASGKFVVTWDGPGSPNQLNPTGLGGLDLTGGTSGAGLKMLIGADQDETQLHVLIFSDATNWSEATIDIPKNGGLATDEVFVPLALFTAGGGNGADFTHVGAVQLELNGSRALDVQVGPISVIGTQPVTQNFADKTPTLLGDLVWRDIDNDGVVDEGEPGIGNVLVNLYHDSDGSGDFTPGVDQLLATTHTDESGRYLFDEVFPGDYVIQIAEENFGIEGPLAGLGSSTGNKPTPDPDNGVDNDDNGDTLVGHGVVSKAFNVASHGNDSETNFDTTVDFGFSQPTLSIDDVTVTEGDAGTSDAAFTVSLSAPSERTVVVDFTTAPGTALSPADFVANSGKVTFLPGVTTHTIVVKVVGDLIDEPTENYLVVLSNPLNVGLDKATGVGTILDDDNPPTISINDVSVTETAGAATGATFTVSLSSASSFPITVVYNTQDGTASNPADYGMQHGTLTFAPGTLTQTVTISIVNDLLDEPDEIFQVVLSAPSNATLSDPTGVGTILDDDNPPTISINDVNVTETAGAVTGATFTVSLSSASSQPITVVYNTQNGSATGPADYATKTGTLTFLPGALTQTVTISIVDDAIDELDENFQVVLSAPSNATLSDPTGVGTILDDDSPPSISINDPITYEGNTAFFVASLSSASSLPITVVYNMQDGTATSPGDYVAKTGTLTFEPGVLTQIVTISVVADSIDEPDENYQMILSVPTNATLSDPIGVGTILDNNDPPTISINDVSVTETAGAATGATFTVSLSSASSFPITVIYNTQDGTATNPADYGSKTGTLTFAPGVLTQTVTISIVNDSFDELDENFQVVLSETTHATLSDPIGVGTIVDDDTSPTISISDVSVVEGNFGTTPATFVVTLSGSSDNTITVDFSTVDGSAVAPDDYVAFAGKLTFLPGETTKTITVLVQGDITDIVDENFSVQLSNATNATIADPLGIGTIVNDDNPLLLTLTATPGPILVGGPLVYTMTVTNTRPITAHDVQVVNTLPGEVAFSSGLTAQGTMSHLAGVVTILLGDMAPGQTITMQITVGVNTKAVGPLFDVATVSDTVGIGPTVNVTTPVVAAFFPLIIPDNPPPPTGFYFPLNPTTTDPNNTNNTQYRPTPSSGADSYGSGGDRIDTDGRAIAARIRAKRAIDDALAHFVDFGPERSGIGDEIEGMLAALADADQPHLLAADSGDEVIKRVVAKRTDKHVTSDGEAVKAPRADFDGRGFNYWWLSLIPLSAVFGHYGWIYRDQAADRLRRVVKRGTSSEPMTNSHDQTL